MPTTGRDATSCFHAISRFWRQSFRKIYNKSSKLLTDEEVCAALGCPSPSQFFRAERARQLLVVARAGPGFLWHLLVSSPEWLEIAFQAMKELCADLQVSIWQSAPSEALGKLNFCREHMSTLVPLPGRHQRAARHQASQALALAKASHLVSLESAGWYPVTEPTAQNKPIQCHLCRASFGSKSALAVHMDKRHNVRLLTKAASGTFCFVCSTEWWSTYRLREHLRRDDVCRTVWNESDLPDAAHWEVTGQRTDKAWKPPLRAAGAQPFLGNPTPAGMSCFGQRFARRLFTRQKLGT